MTSATNRASELNPSLLSTGYMRWDRLATHGRPTPRCRHTATIIKDTAYIFGGIDPDGNARKNLCCYDLGTKTWTRPSTYGDIPPEMYGHSAVALGSWILFFGGGNTENVFFQDTYLLNTENFTWTRINITGNSPDPRRGHSAILYGSYILVFGGTSARGGGLHDLWMLDFKELRQYTDWSWRKLRTHGTGPCQRWHHSASIVNGHMIVVGGIPSVTAPPLMDAWSLDLRTFYWKALAMSPSGSPSSLISAVPVVVGGRGHYQACRDVYLFLNGADSAQLSHIDDEETSRILPPLRGFHAHAVIGSKLYVFGGTDGHEVFSDIWVLEPVASTSQQPSIMPEVPTTYRGVPPQLPPVSPPLPGLGPRPPPINTPLRPRIKTPRPFEHPFIIPTFATSNVPTVSSTSTGAPPGPSVSGVHDIFALAMTGPGINMPVSTFCQSITGSLQATNSPFRLSTVRRRKDIDGVKHEFLLLKLWNDLGKPVWLRLDRSAEQGPKIRWTSFTSTFVSHDKVTLAAEEDALNHKQSPLRSETTFSADRMPTLLNLERLLRITCEISYKYKLFSENCYFFSSVVQDFLTQMYNGEIVVGQIEHVGLGKEVRKAIWDRLQQEEGASP